MLQPWVKEFAETLLTAAVKMYTKEFDGDEKKCYVPAAVFVARPYKHMENVPDHIHLRKGQQPVMVMPAPNSVVDKIFGAKGKRSLLPQLAQMLLSEDSLAPWPVEGSGPAEAMFAVTETFVLMADKEPTDDDLRPSEHPDSQTSVMVTIYTRNGTELMSQRMKGGLPDGEVMHVVDEGKLTGNLVFHGIASTLN